MPERDHQSVPPLHGIGHRRADASSFQQHPAASPPGAETTQSTSRLRRWPAHAEAESLQLIWVGPPRSDRSHNQVKLEINVPVRSIRTILTSGKDVFQSVLENAATDSREKFRKPWQNYISQLAA